MNDYKQLIECLREEADAVLAIEWDIPICTSNHISQAADAIEQLVKERDAAVADIPTACGYCKWFRDSGEVGCFCQEPCSNIGGVNTMWEWRGVGGRK